MDLKTAQKLHESGSRGPFLTEWQIDSYYVSKNIRNREKHLISIDLIAMAVAGIIFLILAWVWL